MYEVILDHLDLRDVRVHGSKSAVGEVLESSERGKQLDPELYGANNHEILEQVRISDDEVRMFCSFLSEHWFPLSPNLTSNFNTQKR